MKRGARRLIIVLAVVVVIVGAMAAGLFGGMGAIRRLPTPEVDLAAVADGAYRGVFSLGRWKYEVEAAVKDHRIESLRRLNAPDDTVTAAIIERILAEQSVSIDTVSGASINTKALALAVEDALAGER